MWLASLPNNVFLWHHLRSGIGIGDSEGGAQPHICFSDVLEEVSIPSVFKIVASVAKQGN